MALSLILALIAAQAQLAPGDPRLESIRSDVVCRAGSGVSGSTEQHEGRITGTGSCDYRITLRRGQGLRATLDADPGINVAIVSPERHELIDDARFVAPASGSYVVRVSQSRLVQRANEPARSFKLRLRVD